MFNRYIEIAKAVGACDLLVGLVTAPVDPAQYPSQSIKRLDHFQADALLNFQLARTMSPISASIAKAAIFKRIDLAIFLLCG